MRTLAWSIGEWLLKLGRRKARVLMVCENEVALLLMPNGQVVNVNGDLTDYIGVFRGVFAAALSKVALDLTGNTTWINALHTTCEEMGQPALFHAIEAGFIEHRLAETPAVPERPTRWSARR